jgi:hypothetical protein
MPHSHRVDEPTELFLGTVASPQSRPLLHSARLVYCSQPFHSRDRGKLSFVTALLPFPSSFVQFAIPLGEDLSGAAFQLVDRCNVSDRAVEPHRIVVIDPAAHDSRGILQR